MKNFEEIKKEVLRYGFQDGPLVNETRIEEWINEGQLQVARHCDTPEFEALDEITMVAGTFKYALPSEFLRMASIVYPLVAVRLKPVDLQTFDSMLGANLTTNTGIEGPPVSYAIWNKEMWLFPTPSSADKLERRYFKRPPRLSGTEIPVLGEDYLHLLVDYALWRAYRAEDDPEMANAHEQQYTQDLAQYRTDLQHQLDDRPQQLQGTWGLPI